MNAKNCLHLLVVRKMKSIVGIMLLIVQIVSSSYAQGEVEELDSYVESMSISAITTYCSSQWFLNRYKLTQKDCLDLLLKLGNQCSSEIRPLVPNLYEMEDRKQRLLVLKSLSSFYRYCLTSKVSNTEDENE